MNKHSIPIFILVIVVLLLSSLIISCSGSPSIPAPSSPATHTPTPEPEPKPEQTTPSAPALLIGQVKGVLVFEESLGRPNSVFLGKIHDEEIELNTSWQSPCVSSTASGKFLSEFLIDDVPPGKYYLMAFSQKNGFGYILTKDERVAFEMPQSSGIDLGKIDVSQVEYLSSN